MKISDLSIEQILLICQFLGILIGSQIATSVLIALISCFSYLDSCNRRDFTIIKRRARRIKKRREQLEKNGDILDIDGSRKRKYFFYKGE